MQRGGDREKEKRMEGGREGERDEMRETRDRFPPGLVLVRAAGGGTVHGRLVTGEAVGWRARGGVRGGVQRRRAAGGKQCAIHTHRFLMICRYEVPYAMRFGTVRRGAPVTSTGPEVPQNGSSNPGKCTDGAVSYRNARLRLSKHPNADFEIWYLMRFEFIS